MSGLDGTGTFLTIDGSGDVTKGTIGAASVTGLSDMQVLYGSPTGTIDQEAAFTYDENDNIATVIGTNVSDIGYRVITNSAPSYYSAMATDRLEVNGEDAGRISIYSNYLQFFYPAAPKTIQWIFNLGGGSDYNWYFCY